MTVEVKKGLYQHYKGGRYQVLDVARHSETEEWFVIYKPLYGEQSTWIRPLAMFVESVDYQGETVPRFRFIAD